MIPRLCIFIVLLSVVAMAAARRNPIPDPELLTEGDSDSIAVVKFREDDEAIKELLEASLNSIATGEAKLPEDMADVSDYLSKNNRADLLFEGLPFQAVRVDRMLPSGETSPTYAFTLAGWRGLQVNVYNSLAAGKDGKAYPSEVYRRTDLVSRPHHDDPTWADNLCKADGTFLFAPTPDQAMKTVDRLMPRKKDAPPGPVSGPLLTAYQALPKTGDAFGVLLNEKGAFSALLKSMDNEHVQKVREKIGSDRLERVVASTKKVVWKIEIASSDRAEFQAVLTLDPKDVAEAVAAFEEGKTSLDPELIVDVVITPGTDSVTVAAAMKGLKKVVLDGLARSGKKKS